MIVTCACSIAWTTVHAQPVMEKLDRGVVAAYTHNANDASAGDLDGDGEYEIVLNGDGRTPPSAPRIGVPK